jgi:hypothetical protein
MCDASSQTSQSGVLAELVSKLGAIGVSSTVETSDAPRPMRVLLGRIQHVMELKYEHRLVPGQIIQLVEGRPVVVSMMMPPPAQITSANLDYIKRQFLTFDVLPVNDGTSIGLYWFDDKWTIRSYNGYDVGSYAWNGDNTFADVLEDVLAAYPEFTLARLNKGRCYTIGIKSTKFHPFLEGGPGPITRAWLVESVDITRVNAQSGSFDGAISTDEDIGLPLQVAITPDRPQCGLMKFPLDLDYINHHARNAIRNYKATGSVFYGVILRSPVAAYIVYSDLFRFIIDSFYTKNIRWAVGGSTFGRQNYLVLYNLFNMKKERKDTFIRLFPQFAPIAARVESLIADELMPAVRAAIDERVVTDSTIPPAEMPEPSERVAYVALELAKRWREKMGGRGGSVWPSLTELHDTLIRSDYAGLVYDLVYTQSAEDQTPREPLVRQYSGFECGSPAPGEFQLASPLSPERSA